MTPNFQSATQNRLTTIAGLIMMLLGGVIPEEARDACFNAITGSDSPHTAGILMIAGVALTIFGPSIAQRTTSKQADSEAA